MLNRVHVLITGRVLSKGEDEMEARRPTKVANVGVVARQRGLSPTGVI